MNVLKRLDHLDTRHRHPFHVISEVLMCLIIGFCAGRSTVKDALEFCQHHLEQLRGHLPLQHGVPSRSTACRVLKMTDQDDFRTVFADWTSSFVSTENTVIIIDGKGERGSAKKDRSERTPYILNAIEASSKLVVNLREVGEKENEKTEFHPLLEEMDLAGSCVIADAMATDQNIMRSIRKGNADFVLQVKKNNPQLYKEIAENMEEVKNEAIAIKNSDRESVYKEALKTYSHHKTFEVNGGRHEYREGWATNDVSLVSHSSTTLPFIKTIGVMEQVRIFEVKDKDGNDVTPSREDFILNGSVRQPHPTAGDDISDPIQRIGLISSKEMTAKELMVTRRLYWEIENSCHYVLDNTFDEDRYHYHVNRFNIGIVRRFAYNIVRLIQTRECPKQSMRGTANLFCDMWEYVEKYCFDGIERAS